MLALLTVLFGYLFASLFIPRRCFIEKLIIGFGIGYGIVAVILTFILLNDFAKYDVVLKILVILNLPLLLANIGFKSIRKTQSTVNKVKFKLLNSHYALLGIIFIFSVILSFSLLNWPIHAWDSITLYDFRAKYFLNEKNLEDLGSLNSYDKNRESYYFSYPLLTTNIHVLSYLDGLSNPKIIYWIFILGFYYLFYKYLIKNKVNSLAAIGLTAILMTEPLIFEVSKLAYTNMIYIYYFVLGSFFFNDWIKEKDTKLLILWGIFIGLSIQVRGLEPFFLVSLGIFGFFALLKRKYLVSFIITSIIVAISYQIWPSIIKYLGLSFPNKQLSIIETLFISLKNFSIPRLVEVTIYFSKSMLGTYSLLLLLFTTVLFFQIYHYKRGKQFRFENTYILLLILGCIFVLYTGTYYLSFYFARWKEIPGSLQRAALPIIPLILAYVGLAAFPVKRLKK